MLGPEKVGSLCTDDTSTLKTARRLVLAAQGFTHIVEHRYVYATLACLPAVTQYMHSLVVMSDPWSPALAHQANTASKRVCMH